MKTSTIKKNLARNFERTRDLFKFNHADFSHFRHFESSLLLEMECNDSHANIANTILINFYTGIKPIRGYKPSGNSLLIGSDGRSTFITDNIMIDIKKITSYGTCKFNGLITQFFTINDYCDITLGYYEWEETKCIGEYNLGDGFILKRSYSMDTKKNIIGETSLKFQIRNEAIIENIREEYLNLLSYEWKNFMERNKDHIKSQLVKINERKEKYAKRKHKVK